MRYIYIIFVFLLFSFGQLNAQTKEIRGYIYDVLTKSPIQNAQVTALQIKGTVLADSLGQFKLELTPGFKGYVQVYKEGYDPVRIYPSGSKLNIALTPSDAPFYNGKTLANDRVISSNLKTGSSTALESRNIGKGYNSVSQALLGKVPSLRIHEKGGMNGEGAFLAMRGIRSFAASNMPLIVVDGLPYTPNDSESPVISGYSKDIFNAIDLKNVASVYFLKGAEAAKYGSMGGNGVLVIETERASSLETKVDFQTINGVNWIDKRLPMMNSMNFKTYIGDIGETRYSDLEQLTSIFPFLKDDPSYHYNYLYAHDTDWQEEIYQSGFSTENMLKIKGGDAIANYALAVGYLNNQGIIKNTDFSKYTLRLNANMQITKKLDMFASVGFAYSTANLAEQGMHQQTNPMLAAIYNAPIWGVYAQNTDGNNLGIFNKVHNTFGISNAAAVVSDVEAENGAYDLLINAGLNYQFSPAFKLTGQFGMFYNYNKENLFIPGLSSGTIAPLMDGLARNTVRQGTGIVYNYYANIYAQYAKSIGNHNLDATLGYQMLIGSNEYDMAEGINTNSDFYKTLNNTMDEYGRRLTGHILNTNWMNAYFTLNYNYMQKLFLGGTIATDASSTTGENADRFSLLPSATAGISLKNVLFPSASRIDNLMIRGEYAHLANSRFSPHYSKNYYHSKVFQDMSGLVKGGVSNTQLHSERNIYQGVGMDLRMFGNRVVLSADLYNETTEDMLVQRQLPAAAGYGYTYDNNGEIKTEGIDLSIHLTPIQLGEFKWSVGGTISKYESELTSLGGENENMITFSDGASLLNRVGESPYQFYGYQTEKVIYSSEEAQSLGYVNAAGTPFEAGDMKFKDLNGDKIINEKDMKVLGSATPDFAGSFYTDFRYKGVSLNVLFTYSKGNEIYNVVRRSLESMDDFKNQSTVAQYRWTFDGQETNIHKAEYGDPMGNARFSDRWIEDGSYLKVKNITLGYDFSNQRGIFKDVNIYLMAENLFTFTDYLGMDPEFSYSYSIADQGIDQGKTPLAKSVKLGVRLGF